MPRRPKSLSPPPPPQRSSGVIRQRAYRAALAKAADAAALENAIEERRLYAEMNARADAEIEAMHQAATDEFFSIQA